MKTKSQGSSYSSVFLLPRLGAFVVTILLALGATPESQGAQRTWSGGGSDNNWGTAANWGGTAPASGDSVVFADNTRITNFNNIAGLQLTGISFLNSDFLAGGNTITNSGGIYDNSGMNTNNCVTYLNGSQGITNAVSGTVLQLGGIQTNMGTANVLTFGGPGNIYVTGVINGHAVVNINGDGAGNGLVRWSAANTFVGPLTVNSGTLTLANATAIPTGNGNGDVTNNATIDLNGNSQAINNLYGTGTMDNKTGTSTYTLTVGNNATNQGGAFEFDGIIQNSSGTVALTKVNTNIFFLNGGSDTYSGATLVSAGQLILGSSASLPNTASITVSQGAQLNVTPQSTLAVGASTVLYAGRNTNNGPGDILGSVDNSGKMVIYKPAFAGTMNITNNLTLEGGSDVAFDLANTNTVGGGSNDLVAINGTLTLNGGTIELNPYTGTFATGTYGTYTLITNSQALENGSAANMTVSVPRGVTATLDDQTFPGSLLVSMTGSGIPVSLVWDGTSGANWDVQITQDWLNNGNPDYFYYLDNVVFNDVGNGNVNVATGVTPSSTTFNNSATNTYTMGGPGAISGSGPLSINNNGTVIFNTPNNYTGNTYVNYGQLDFGTYNGGTSVNNVDIYNGVTPGTVLLGNGGLYIVDTANTFYTETFGLTINPGGSSIAMRSRQSNSTTYSYQIPSNPVRNVGGTLDINNLQTRSGSTVGVYIPPAAVVNGILGGYASLNLNDWVVPANTTTGSGAYAGYENSNNPALWGTVSNIVLSANPTASVNSSTINSLKLTGPSAVTINSSQTLTLSSGGILVPNNAAGASSILGGLIAGSPSGDLVVLENAVAADSLTIASTIADSGGATALTKAGLGTLILTGNNTYSGVTYINGATIAGNGNTTPGVNAAGTLQVGTGGTAGNLGNTATVTNYGTLTYDRSDNITLSIPMNGPGGLRQLGGGVLTVTGNNTFSGPTTVSAGTLQVGNGSAAGSLGTTSSVTNNSVLVFDLSNSATNNGPINGSGTLIQFGSGSLVLNSPNNYSGLTIISNGTVLLGGGSSIPNSSGVVLSQSGSTLDVSAVSGGLALTGGSVAQVLAGFGTVNGSVTATNNTMVTPGTNNVVGTLTVNNNLTLAGGTIFLDVGTSSKDLLSVGGALNLNGGAITVNDLNTLPNATYKLISYGSLGGAVTNIAFSGFNQPGQLAYLTNNTTAGEIDMVVYNGSGANLLWVGDGVNNFWDVAVSADWNNGSGASVFHNNDTVTFDDTSANPGVVLNASDTPAKMTINTLVNNYNFSGSGSVVGGGSVIINATNTTVTITAPILNSGPTVINTGSVQVGNGGTEGSIGTGTVTNNGALTFNEPVDSTFGGSLSGSGLLFQSGSTALTLNGNNSLYVGGITINSGVVNVGGNTGSGSLGTGPVTNNGTLLVDRTGTLTVNNSITGSGVVAFIGSGTVNYGGINTYANNTYISNGIVKLGAATAIYSDGSAGDWLILDGAASGGAGTFDLNGNSVAVNALSGVNAAANGLIEDNAASTTSTLSIIGSATTTYSGTIADNGGSGGKVALFVGGAANQSFDVESVAGNSYTGGTVISNAIVTIRSSYSGAQANFPTPVGLGTAPITLVSNGTVYAAGAEGQSTSPTWNSLANTINIPAGQTGTVYGPQRGTMLGNITGAGILNYINCYVRGAISGNWGGFTGQIIFGNTGNGGQLGIASTTGLGHVFCTNTIGGALPAVVIYNTVAGTPIVPIGELADDGSSQIESTTSGNAGGVAANFAVGGLNTSTNYGGSIIDNVGIIKVGTGAWSLTGSTLTYSGLTTVSNGVLVLGASAALPNTTPITLMSPGILDASAAGTFNLGASTAQTLQGNSQLNGSLNVGASGTVSPGPGGANSIGTLTVTNAVTLGGTIIMELNRTNSPGSNDMLVATSVAAGGTLQVNNLGPDLHTGDTFKLFSVPVTGTFTVTNLPVTTGNGSITYVWTNNLAVDGTIGVLVGVPNEAINPTNIIFSVSGNQLSLSWPADHTGWYLQVQTNSLGTGLGATWVDVPGSSSVNSMNFTVSPTNPTVFYRMSLNP